METKGINLHMDQKRALYIMLFFAMLLALSGVLAVKTSERYCVQLNSLLHSDYEYSVISKNCANQNSYYLFNAGITFSESPESAVGINADILMQSRDSHYTKSIAWNALKLNADSVAVSSGIARAAGLKVGDELFSKHIVDGKNHAYTVQQILPDIITARMVSNGTYSDGIVIMGADDLYIENLSHSFVSYTNASIDDLSQELSEMPERILYRSDEITEVFKGLTPYFVLFMIASLIIVIILTGFLTQGIKYNFKRLMTLGYPEALLNKAYGMHIGKWCFLTVCIGFVASIVASILSGINPITITMLLVFLFAEAVAIILSALLLNRGLIVSKVYEN